MHLTVIIVNYRTPQWSIECLASLAAERAIFSHMRVMLVDNASCDESVGLIQEAVMLHGWGGWVSILPQKQNLGFAGGNNVAIRRAVASEQPPDFLLLLNSDTVVHPGCLQKSVERMQSDPRIGALSCMVRNRDGSVQNVCRKFAHPLRETFRALGLPYALPRFFHWADLEDLGWNRQNTAREVEWIGGAFMLLRSSVIRELGPLDESFFFYGEDIELCHRIRRGGWQIYFDPVGEITHYGGGSSDGTRLEEGHKLKLAWKARLHIQKKCHGSVSALWIRSLYLFSVTVNLLLMWVKGRRGSSAWVRTAKDWRVLVGPLKP